MKDLDLYRFIKKKCDKDLALSSAIVNKTRYKTFNLIINSYEYMLFNEIHNAIYWEFFKS